MNGSLRRLAPALRQLTIVCIAPIWVWYSLLSPTGSVPHSEKPASNFGQALLFAYRGIYEIKLIGADGFEQKIQATDDHPFYVVGDGWKTTIELALGDYIETDGDGDGDGDGDSAMMVTSVIDEKRQDLTYNFTVEDYHTYYVTERKVLVHNCNKKAGVKKQGRELKNKARSKGNFKSNNNRRSEKAAKKHTPSKKHTKMTKKKRNLDKRK